MELNGIDHLELCVGDLDVAVRWLSHGFGFRVTGQSQSEPGVRRLLLQQGSVRLVLTQPRMPGDSSAAFVELHGDGVRDVALGTPDAAAAFHEAVRRGAVPVHAPSVDEGPGGRVVWATVASPVDGLVHSFIQREVSGPDFWPGRFQPVLSAVPERELMVALDHVALCLMPGTLAETVRAYGELFGLHESHEETVVTQYGGMNSKVVQDASGRVCFPMQEPRQGKLPGQLERFLSNHRGPGVQHLAFLSEDILESVRELRERQVSFLDTPPGYYEALAERVGAIDEDLEVLRAGHVLVDREGEGYLLQLFTRSTHVRRTLFFEIIQRKQSRGFGGANVRALYQSVEQEMLRREPVAAAAAAAQR